MPVIDSDAHVEESVETWRHLEPEFYPLRPIPVTFPEDTCFGEFNAAWVIDYKLRLFAANPTSMKVAQTKNVPIPVQEMRDVRQRLASMDELGIDKQVVFPSLWLGCLAENVELEAALARSYNQFMATQCSESGGRLWYVAAVHTGNGSSPTISRLFEGVPRGGARPPLHPLAAGLVSGPYVLYAFQQILGSTILQDFPRLRVGFLEAGSEWAVRLVKGLRERKDAKVDEWLGERVFVSCKLDEDLAYITDRLGDDFLITATDFPHADAFRQDRLRDCLTRRSDLSERKVEKILSDNPQRFFPT